MKQALFNLLYNKAKKSCEAFHMFRGNWKTVESTFNCISLAQCIYNYYQKFQISSSRATSLGKCFPWRNIHKLLTVHLLKIPALSLMFFLWQAFRLKGKVPTENYILKQCSQGFWFEMQ